MKIAKVDVFRLAYTLPVPRGDGRGLSTARATTMVRVTTDDGVYGWGLGGQPGVLSSVVPVLVGEDPRDTGRLWHRVFSFCWGY